MQYISKEWIKQLITCYIDEFLTAFGIDKDHLVQVI